MDGKATLPLYINLKVSNELCRSQAVRPKCIKVNHRAIKGVVLTKLLLLRQQLAPHPPINTNQDLLTRHSS